MFEHIPPINIDTILSDPLLIVASALLVIGPLLFLISFWKLIRFPKPKNPLFDPVAEPAETFLESEPAEITPVPSVPEEKVEKVVLVEPPPAPPSPPPPPVVPVQSKPISPQENFMDKTVVMPAGMGEIQGQLEIAFTQLKSLNKRIYELEVALSEVAQPAATPLELNNLKEPPMNPADFTQKLLKLAEHVIVLEKNMSKLLSQTTAKSNEDIPPVPTKPHPPVMPL
jgi:hypothetical protein